MEELLLKIAVELAKQTPSAIAIIVVVVLFLRYMDKLVSQWMKFIQAQNKQYGDVLEKISGSLIRIEEKLIEHDKRVKGEKGE